MRNFVSENKTKIMIMNNQKSNEMNLIRSRTLAVLFSLLVSALILLPLLSSAKSGDKPSKSATVSVESLNTVYVRAVTLASFDDGNYTLTIENENGENIYSNEVMYTPERISEMFDLSKLDNGNYTLKIKSKDRVQVRYFNLYSGKIKAFSNQKENYSYSATDNQAVFIMLNSSNIYTFKY